MKEHSASNDQNAHRAIARRTAWVVGGIALVIYLVSILEVVLRR
ncbi:hypothetical protein [Dokdonella soli]